MSDDMDQARKQLEKILGGPIGGPRIVPGSKAVSGREFLYISCEPDLSPKALGDQFTNVLGASPIVPREGSGALSENCTLTLPSGECFFALSYKGDLGGWRAKAEQGARTLKRRVARIKADTLVIDDGRQVELADCAVRYF